MTRHSKPLLVSFSGIDGAGKSTQIERLHSRLTANGVAVVQLAFWDNVVFLPHFRAAVSQKVLRGEQGIGAPHRPVRRNDKNARKWYLTLARSPFYLLDVLRLRRVVAKVRQANPDVIIFDRYIYDQLANVSTHWLGRAYVRFILKLAPRPDVAYLLDANPDAALKRKPEYPFAFLSEYRRAYLALRDMAPELRIVSPTSLEEAARMIAQEFDKSCSPEIRIFGDTVATTSQPLSA